MATVIYQGKVIGDDNRGLDRLPQFLDAVEHRTNGDRGEVRGVNATDDTDATAFYVRWSCGLTGWYKADELVVHGGAPASDPAAYA